MVQVGTVLKVITASHEYLEGGDNDCEMVIFQG